MGISCTKCHGNRLIIDGEIDEKHALQIIVIDYSLNTHFVPNNCDSIGLKNELRTTLVMLSAPG